MPFSTNCLTLRRQTYLRFDTNSFILVLVENWCFPLRTRLRNVSTMLNESISTNPCNQLYSETETYTCSISRTCFWSCFHQHQYRIRRQKPYRPVSINWWLLTHGSAKQLMSNNDTNSKANNWMTYANCLIHINYFQNRTIHQKTMRQINIIDVSKDIQVWL